MVPYAATSRPEARIGGSNAGDARLHLYDSSDRRTICLSGATGILYLGTSGEDGDIEVHNSSGARTFRVDGDTGNVIQTRTGNGLAKAAVYARCAW